MKEEVSKFLVGQEVTIKATGRTGRVIAHTIAPSGKTLILVDQPHGKGMLRQHFAEEALQ